MGFQSCRLPARKRSETLQTLQMLPKPAKPSKHRPPNRHPRAKATSPTGTPGPRPLPQQAPQGQATAMAFYGLSKLPFASPQTLRNSPNPPNAPKTRQTLQTPSFQQAPQGQGHFPNRHPRARPQQWLSMGFQSCRLPARKRSESLQTLQMLPKPAKPSKHRPPNRHPRAKATSPTGTPGPRPLPQQAPQGQATAMAFYGLSKLPFASPQTLRNSPNPPNAPKTRQTLQTPSPQQAPQGQGHFPNRHPRARPQQWLSMGFQSCRLPARKRSETLQTLQMLPKPAKPSKHRPQQAPQIHSNDLLKLSKLPFASLQRLQPHLPQQAPQGQGHFPNRHPRAKATSRTGTPRPGHSNGFLWAFKAAVCQPANAPKLSKPSKCSQNPLNPPNTVLPTGTPGPRPLPQQAPQGQGHFPNRHPKARPQQWLSMGFQSCRLPARKRSETLQTLQMLPKPAKPSKHRPPNRHPRAQATSPTGTPGPGHSNGFLWAFKAAVCQPANAPKLSKRSKCSQNPPNPPNTVRPTGTPGPRPLPQQAPQGQGHFPNRHPKARPQQWLSMGFQSCRLPARKRSETLQTLQMLPKPAKPSKHRPPNRHPRAKATSPTGTPGPGHSNGFLWAFKAAVCQPANAPNLFKRSKCFQNPPNPPNTVRPTGTPGPRPLPQQAPQGQGHFPNRHPKARPQQWLSMGFQSCRLPARKRSETLQTLQMLPKPAKPSKHRPPNRHPRAKATSPTGTPGPGHSNGFLWAFKAAVCQPANAPKLSKRSKCSQNPPNPPNTVPSRPPRSTAMTCLSFQSCRLPACKGCNPTFPNRHPRAKATSRTGTPRPGHSNGFLWAFKAAVCQPANAPKLSKPSKCSPNPPNPPNTVLPTGTPGPRPLPQQAPQGQATAMAFYGLSKLPFASPQTLRNSPNPPNAPKTRQTLQTPSPQQAPQGPGHFPNRHPRARPQQWLSMGFQSCRLPARKRSETLQTLQMLPKPAKPSKHRPQQAPQIHSNDFLEAFKAAVCQPAKAANPPSPTGTPVAQQAPQGQGHFPNRHPKAKPQQWLSMGFQSCRLPARKRSKPKARPQQWLSMGFQSCRLPARKSCNPTFPNRHPRPRPRQWLSMGFRKRSETLQTLQMLPKPAKPSKHRPPNRYPRAKATSPTGTPGPRPLPQQAPQGQATAMAFYGLSKLPFASPQTLRNSPNPPNAPKTRQTLQTPSPQQAPQGQGHFPNRHPRARPQQLLSMGFQSCRLPARKRSETLQTLQMLPKPAKPSKHRPQQDYICGLYM